MLKSLLLPLVLSATAMLAGCAGVGRVPPVSVDAAAPRTPEPGNYAAIVQSRQWVLTTAPGPYECGPLGVHVDANGSYQDAMRAVLTGALEHVTFVSTVLTPEQLKGQGFDAQIIVSQGTADADLVGAPLPGRTARSDVNLTITVAVRDQRGAVAQKTVSGYARGKGEGADCRQIVAAIGDAAQTAIGSIARQSAAYVAGALRDRRVARAAPVAPKPAPPPPKPVVEAHPPQRESPVETVQDTLRGALAAGAVAAPVEASGSEAQAEAKTGSDARGAAKPPPAGADHVSAHADIETANARPTEGGALGASAVVDQAASAAVGSAAAAGDSAPPSDNPPHVAEESSPATATDDAVSQADAHEAAPPPREPNEATATKAPAERPARPETVAMAVPRAARPSPSAGSISAEEAFVRGADAAAGRGGPKSDAEALKWYRIAAAKGYAPAQNNLGFMYAEGRGVPRNDAEAVKWYKRAAAQKYPPAETGLGMMYAAGRGVKQSDFEALALYSSAANQGYGQAKANLAAMFGEGRGVERDIMTATFLLGSVHERPYTGSGVYVEPSTEQGDSKDDPGSSESAYQGQ